MGASLWLERTAKILLASCLSFAVAPLARSQAPPGPARRITQPIDNSNLVTLRGNTHPLARPQFDRGAVADSQPIRRMLLLLQRSPQQETALRQLLDQQQSRASASYHRWLTPQQMGQQFGPAAADIQTVANWLQSEGFQVARISAAGTIIEFSGNAGQVRSAFHTEIHRYAVNGEERFANNSDPQIPAALASVVAGPVSLNSFPKDALLKMRGLYARSGENGAARPMFSGTYNNSPFYALGPADFAKIYNVPGNATGNGNPNGGTGQTIAIVGDSEICTAHSPDWMTSYIGPSGTSTTCSSDDVANFRSAFGLQSNPPNVILDGPDPGFNADETEGDLDVEWSGGIAPFATIDFVIAEDTEATYGVDLAAEYVVDNDLAPVVSESFGACEAALGENDNLFYATLWEQADAQGMTPIVAAGDSGSAGCDDEDLPSPNAAYEFGPAVNGIASTPFNVAAGGTDFDAGLSNYYSTYWNSQSANAPTTFESAKSYIPETSWNDSCAQNITSPSSIGGCTPPPNATSVNIVAGGGGQSNCLAPLFNNSGALVECQVPPANTTSVTGYQKPSWQMGSYLSGLATSDGVRDVPDISLFAADGLISNSFYTVCEADEGGTCSITNGSLTNFYFLGVGGTSSAAPTFAAIMSLVNQNDGGPQGNANYVLYPLATLQLGNHYSCISTSSPDTAHCAFYDIAQGNNSVPCYGETYGCSNQVNPNTYGELEQAESNGEPNGSLAFPAGSTYDLATGLGTINAQNLINQWPSVSFTGTTTTLCIVAAPATTCTSPAGAVTIQHGQQVNVTINVTPAPPDASTTQTEDASLIGTCVGVTGCTLGGNAAVDRFTSNNYDISNANIYSLTGGTTPGASTESLIGGTYNVIAHYAGDGSYGSSYSTSPIAVTVTPESSTLTVAAGLINFNATQNPVSLIPNNTTVFYGDAITLRADVVGVSSGQENATGNVTFTDVFNSGSPTTLGTFALNTEGYTEDQTGSNIDGVSNVPALAVGSHVISASYSGDPSYSASSTSAPSSFTVAAAPTTTQITSPANGTVVTTGHPVTLTALVDTQSSSVQSSGGSSGAPPAGTITFENSSTGAAIGNAVTVIGTTDSAGYAAATASLTFTPTASVNVDAIYNPSNSEYQPSESPVIALTAGSGGISAPTNGCSATINLAAAGDSGTCLITVTGTSSFAGNVTMGVILIGSPANSAFPPTCTFSASTITLSTSSETGSTTLTCSSTAPSSTLLFGPSRRGPYFYGRQWQMASGMILLAGLLALLAFALPARLPSLPRRWAWVSTGMLFLAITLAGGCGTSTATNNNVYTGPSSSPGTTTGTYTYEITAAPAGGTTQNTTLTVNVQ